MAVKFEYPEGATPLDPDDAAGLIPSHVTTQGQLNEWEFQNVAEGRAWALSGNREAMTINQGRRQKDDPAASPPGMNVEG
jgi:hypothetical protein